MKRTSRTPELARIPTEPSIYGFLRMSEWLLNTCGTLYKDRQVSEPNHYAFYEFDAPLWLQATVKPSGQVVAKRPTEAKKRIPHLTVIKFEAFIRDDGSEFNVLVPDMSNMDEEEREKQKEAVLDPIYGFDGYHVMRDYCYGTHAPVPNAEREVKFIEFSTLMNSGPITGSS